MKFICYITVLLVILTACHTGKETIKIGAIYNLTGNLKAADIPAANAAKLAVKQINLHGGINGKLIELIMLDGKSDSAEIAKATQSLIKHSKVRLIIGLCDPDLIQDAAEIATLAKIPFITSGASSSVLTRGNSPYLWSISSTAQTQASAMADFAFDYESLRTCLILTDTSKEINPVIAKYYRDAYTIKNGWVVKEEPFDGSNLNTWAISERVKTGLIQPAMIYIASSIESSSEIVAGLRRAGIRIPIYGGDCFDTSSMLTMTAGDSSIVVCATHIYLGMDSVIPQVPAFIQAYQAEYGNAPENGFAGLGYDTVYFAANALLKSTDNKTLSLLQAIPTTELRNGVTGRIAFKDGAHTPIKQVSIISLTNGERHELASISKQLPILP